MTWRRTWSDYDVGRTAKSERVFDDFRNAHEHAENMRADVSEIPKALACFAGLPLQICYTITYLKRQTCNERRQASSLPPLITMEMKNDTRRPPRELSYSFAVFQFLNDGFEVNRCVLECG